jgi:hypothetical protein
VVVGVVGAVAGEVRRGLRKPKKFLTKATDSGRPEERATTAATSGERRTREESEGPTSEFVASDELWARFRQTGRRRWGMQAGV